MFSRNLGEKDAPKNAHMVIEWEALDEEAVKAHRAANTSVTDESDLTALMNMADLAGRDFTAERENARVIFPGATCVSDKKITASDEQKLKMLPIPVRPPWTKEMSAQQVDSNEKESFLHWRRELARIEESYDVVLTPFEKNLEFWRQLWRVVEKSDVVVQVVDARNPMLYRCEALENYVRSVGAWKGNVILFNKADLLPRQVFYHTGASDESCGALTDARRYAHTILSILISLSLVPISTLTQTGYVEISIPPQTYRRSQLPTIPLISRSLPPSQHLVAPSAPAPFSQPSSSSPIHPSTPPYSIFPSPGTIPPILFLRRRPSSRGPPEEERGGCEERERMKRVEGRSHSSPPASSSSAEGHPQEDLRRRRGVDVRKGRG